MSMNHNENPLVLALDQGTTSSRAILFDRAGTIISMAQEEHTQFFPQPGWVEHDPVEIWYKQLQAARSCLAAAGNAIDRMQCIGITNQRETTVLWDRHTGKPVYNAIVWQCRRSTGICEDMISSGMDIVFRNRTGLRLDPYFSGTKLTWLFRKHPEILERAKSGDILFGTIDSWLLWNLTGNHYTDITNASRTLLFNIYEEDWDKDLLNMLGIPEAILPTVLSCSADFGITKPGLLEKQYPVTGVAGDQQAALFGHTCFKPGMAKNTYGTGCFSLLNTGEKPVWSKHNLLTTIAWKIGKNTTYALEGSVFIGGAVIQWLRDELQLLHSASESETVARSVPDSGGVYMVPAFVGLGAPYWDPSVRGAVLGLTRGTKTAHLVRAALESIAYQSEDLLAAMSADYGRYIDILKTDGGATANSFLMQFQADISGIPVLLPAVNEITALGAAYFAGLRCGIWKNLADIEDNWMVKCEHTPQMSDEERTFRLDGWHKAVAATRGYT